MNASLMSLEIWVIVLGLVLMLADLFDARRAPAVLGYAAIAALGVTVRSSA